MNENIEAILLPTPGTTFRILLDSHTSELLADPEVSSQSDKFVVQIGAGVDSFDMTTQSLSMFPGQHHTVSYVAR